MILGLDHIAIATADLTTAIAHLSDDLGLSLAGQEDVPSAQTRTAFLPVSGTRIELIQPMNGEGPVARHLARRGPGLHHLCFRVDDVEAEMARLSDLGYAFLSDAPAPGAHGTRVVFLHPKSCGGVLIELAEHPE